MTAKRKDPEIIVKTEWRPVYDPARANRLRAALFGPMEWVDLIKHPPLSDEDKGAIHRAVDAARRRRAGL